MRWIEERGARARFVPTLVLATLLAPALSTRAQQPLPPAASTPAKPPARFVVVIDAAHGGADAGARLSDKLMEKELVLGLSVRLRSVLTAHGMYVVTTRESDTAMPALNRAEAANHTPAAACITIHATASGNGVHLFTSSLTQIPLTRFLPWETAQGAYTDQSIRLAAEINSAMTHAEIPVTLGRTALQPLDSFTCPAAVAELAPLNRSVGVTTLSDSEYQDRLVEQWQRDWRPQP
jgi:N-acetylmuramoyl-L-alanine amidase